MKLLNISFFALVLCTQNLSTAQTPQKLNLDKVAVFLKGAELVSTAKVSLTKGENEYLFTNVAGSISRQSIVASATNGVVVESITFQNNYTAIDNVSPKIKEIKDSITLLETRREPITNKVLTIGEQIIVLQNNRKVSGDNTGLTIVELQKMLDLVGTKMDAYYDQKDKLESDLAKLNEHILGLKRQLSEEQKKGYQPGGQLLVKFFAKENTASNISISYVVPNAGWSPTYDIWADDAKGPVQFFYKANIYQNSGVKWNNVHLTLSTGNPQEGMQAPVLRPSYLSFYVPPNTKRRRGEEVFTDRNVVGFGDDLRAYRGNAYSKQQFQEDGEVEERDSIGHIPYYRTTAGMSSHVAVSNEGVNTSFDIDLPYTIPSDGQEHLVAIKRYETPATYEYFTAPKADNDAFLLAKITGWQDLNLLSGPTNIFYQGTFVGQGTLDMRNVKDTMKLSLGRDKKIVVKRERDKDYRSVKMIGTNVREEYAYNITVRNTRKETIIIALQDLLPVSNDKDIVIEDVKYGGADHDDATGILTWSLTQKGNETKTLKFGYTVKYPKGRTLSTN